MARLGRMGTDGSPRGDTLLRVCQESTSHSSRPVICLPVHLLRKIPGTPSGPYAVLESGPVLGGGSETCQCVSTSRLSPGLGSQPL